MKKTFKQGSYELADGTLENLDNLQESVVFNSPALRSNPFHKIGKGNAFTSPAYVGISNSYSYRSTDGVEFECEYVDPGKLVRNKDGGFTNKTKIALKNGSLIVPPNSPGLYEFLHFHPANGALETRPKSVQVRMVEVPRKETAEEAEARMAQVNQALKAVMNMTDAEVIDMIDQFGLSASGGPQVRKNTLTEYAKENSSKILSAEAPVVVTTLDMVTAAMEAKIIYFAGVNKTFYWDKDLGDADNKILVSAAGKDLDALAEYIEDDTQLLELLKSRV